MALTKVGRSLLNTGVADSSDATAITISSAEDATFAGHVLLADSKNIKIGAGTDLQLYHDGSNSYITNSTGALKIATETSGIAVTIGHTTSETTIADNLTVTGTIASAVITADGLDMGDSEKIRLGASQDLEIYHDGSHSYVYDGGTGNIVLKTNNGAEVDVMGGSEYMAKFIKDGAVELYYDDSKKIETTSAGATVTGTLTATLSGNVTGNITGQVLTGGQTNITSLLATDIKIGEDDQTKIDFETADEIHFYAANAEQVYVADGVFGPQTNNDVDLGASGVQFKDGYFDGTVYADAIDLNGTTLVSSPITALNNATANELVTVGSTTTELDAETTLIYDGTNMSIGTATPNSYSGYTALTIDSPSDGDGSVLDLEYRGTRSLSIYSESASSDINVVTNHPLVFRTNNTERFRIAASGQLGIGGTNYGTDGQVLTSTGASSAPAWEDAGGGGASAINDLSDAKPFGTSSIMLGDATTGVINAANYNTGFGVDVFDDLTEGDSNVSIGYQSGYELTTGGSNTFVGTNAGRVVVSGAENVAIGKDAYLAGTASNNVVVGTDAMKATTSGTQQVAVGKAAMQSNTTGNYNTAFGAYAGQDNAQGSNNTYIGYQAGKDINYTSGEQASENTFVGYQAGHQLTTPSRGTYVGRGAGGNMIQGPTHQTAVGMYSLYGHYGTYSTGVGYGCYQTGSGAYLAGLGYGHSCTGASSIHIGYNISDNTSNQINMGGGSTYITCDYSSGSSWSGGSDERMKKDITTATLGLSFINDLRPVTFKWKAPSEFPTSWETYSPPTYVNSLGDTIEQETEPQSTDTVHGLVAQEVKTALDTAGVSTFSGWSERDGGQQCISKEMFVIPLINAVNELTTRLEAAEAKITALESE